MDDVHICRYASIFYGADRDRTDDLHVANVALSQLSYCPKHVMPFRRIVPFMLHLSGVCLPTELLSASLAPHNNKNAPLVQVIIGPRQRADPWSVTHSIVALNRCIRGELTFIPHPAAVW